MNFHQCDEIKQDDENLALLDEDLSQLDEHSSLL